MQHSHVFATLATLLPCATLLAGPLTLLPLFSDNMVLQRNAEAPIWGKAVPGQTVTVRFAGQTKTCITGKDGRWRLCLSPMEESRSPRDLVVSTPGAALTLKNVLVGEVWLCSGQSNMVHGFGASTRPADFRTDYPLIREFTVPRTMSATKEDSFKPLPHTEYGHRYEVNRYWSSCTPKTAGRFSAVGLFFAIALHRQLGVPIGIINCSFNGSAARYWVPPAVLKTHPDYTKVLAQAAKGLKDYHASLPIYTRQLALFNSLNAQLI